MSSTTNVELARRAYEAFNRRDLEAFLALMDEEVESVSRIVDVEGVLSGHDGIRRWWASWLEAFPDYRIEVLELRDRDEATVAAIRALGHGGGSSLPIEDTIWHAARWRGGKCVWWRVFTVRAEALEAAGMSE